MKQLETDYLVIGSGAVGMSFVDTMLDETDARFVIVDRHHMPGGHWNDAYSFVRLHQPSAFYGVASTELGSNRIDRTGLNTGFYELASGAEISAYFEKVMRERFLSSGRVQYFPMCNYVGNGQFHSLLSEQTYQVNIAKRLVDGTFFNTSVPSRHNRKFAVADGVVCIPPNDLPRVAHEYKRFTVLGGGKTAMDVCVWLLDNGADAERITWVCPRDSWLMTRETTQPGLEFFEKTMGGVASNIEAMRDAASVEDLFLRLESVGTMTRIDTTKQPEMFHYATISVGEIEQLRRIKNVVRGERIAELEPDAMITNNGNRIVNSAETIYIDCTARAVEYEDGPRPIFEPERITLQVVFAPLLTYSAAVIAYVEANFETDKERNELCRPIQLADKPEEWMASTVGNMTNSFAWSQNKPMRHWTNACRLNPNAAAIQEGAGKAASHKAIGRRIRDSSIPAVMNMHKLIEKLGADA